MVLVFIFQAMQLIVMVIRDQKGMANDVYLLYAFLLARQLKEIVQ